MMCIKLSDDRLDPNKKVFPQVVATFMWEIYCIILKF